MRVTRESLIRIARDATRERAYRDHSIVASYLIGSLITDQDPLLGGTADIDLVLVHSQAPDAPRQIVKLTPDFHLDILHRTRNDYASPRELRTDPFLGWELYDPMLLYQREKFFEPVQAGLRAGFEFNAPALVLGRCRTLYSAARQTWFVLSDIPPDQLGATDSLRYLAAVNDAVNAVAELTGGPLAERRLLRDFPARAQAAELPNLTAELFNLVGAPLIDAGTLESWLEPWKVEFLAATGRGRVDGRIHPARINYYEKAIRAQLEEEMPLAGLWPLINTWTMAAVELFEPFGGSWTQASQQLGLLGAPLADKLVSLDTFLDAIEARLDDVASANGLETSTSI